MTFLPRRPALASLLAGMTAVLISTAAQAAPLSFDLPAQPLADSVQQVAQAAGLSVAVDSALLADRRAPALRGEYEADAALEQLLAGSGLSLVREGTLLTIVATIPVQSRRESAPDTVAEQAPAPIQLEPVMVRGELLTREAAHTTSSVAVHTGAELDRRAVRDVYEVIAATPNASLDDSDYGFAGMTLRGINGYGASGAGGFAAYSTTSTVVLDGVGLPRSALGNVDLSAFDLESVEVLRGPQSTSQGRNAMAGAVIVNTIAPQVDSAFIPEIRGRLAGGSEGSWQGAAALGATLWPDRLAVRLVTDQRHDDGDITNVTRGEDAWERRRSGSTRFRAHWTPGGPDGRYSALLSAAEMSLYQGSRYVLASEEHTRVSFSDAHQDYDNDTQLVSLEQRLRLTDLWSVRLISAYIRSDTQSRFDLDYSAENLGVTVQQENARGHSQELRLDYGGDAVRGSFGVFWFDGEDGDVSNAYLDSSIYLPTSIGAIISDSEIPAYVEDIGVFGELDWSITDRLTLTAGLRYDREKNGRTLTTAIRGDRPVLNVAVRLLQAAEVLPANGTEQVSREFSEVLPKLALSYEIFDDWFVGAAYAEGYRPGGDGYNQVSGRRFSFDSERTRNVDLSFKGQYSPWRLWASLNLFHTRWEDLQVQGGEGVDTFIENAGLANVRGGELELRWRPLDALQFVGSYGVTYGRFKEYVTTDEIDLSGYRLPKAPKYAATLAFEWTPGADLMIRPEVLWSGATPANADNAPRHELFAHHLVNLSLRWQPGQFALFVAGTNLTDEHYRRDANGFSLFGVDTVSLGDRRRVFGGVEFQF